ncbi:energy-coupling factor transporter transmembrane protein EcfT [Agromyces intestinalis]|uniref:Energy-coupling factor transporter transmembrane protein EcfT n=1 Tax=Agromyces intestinalis TaxID=2592652 RepID=A0A5C1YJE1_9MICO|nr:energy-coupling factor transporter transmembrane protein EcfT [Agromyces intestinalis]QEO15655.1 energy-coupling factor transporter transmembrane protein EcfT [Agromyces intestinalis]
MIGLYHPGRSLVHRMPALAKLGALALIVGVSAAFSALWVQLLLLGVTAVCFVLARIPVRVALAQLVPLAWILAIAVPVQFFFGGWEAAATMSTRLTVAVALAALYTLTTPVPATLDAMQRMLRPLRRFIDPDRVGLALALAIRCLPLLAEIVRAVIEARRARGAEGSPLALAVPVVVRALQSADELGDALIARGFDD